MPESYLPVHPRTGLSAIGLLRNGAPIWPVLGGSDDGHPADSKPEEAEPEPAEESDGDTSDDVSDGDDADGDDKPLGPAGEKALLAEKAKARTLRATLRQLKNDQAAKDAERDAELETLRKQVAKLTPKPAAPKKADSEPDPDPGPDLDEIRAEAAEQARAEAMAQLQAERVVHRIEVLAAKRFQDTEDALAQLMRTNEVEDFLDDGKVDVEAIKEALDELLERKPYLAVPAQGEAKRFRGSGDGGAKPNKPVRARSLGEALSRKLNPSS
jgi:hypothetical protein